MRTRVQIDGLQDVLRDLAGQPKSVFKAARKGMLTITDPIAKEASRRAPRERGHLRGAIRSLRPSVKASTGKITGGVIAGGKPLEAHLEGRKLNVYAVVQHQGKTLKHDDGEALFVERPFMSALPHVPGKLEAIVEEALRDHGAR